MYQLYKPSASVNMTSRSRLRAKSSSPKYVEEEENCEDPHVGGGVCEFCKRHFKNLSEHFLSFHRWDDNEIFVYLEEIRKENRKNQKIREIRKNISFEITLLSRQIARSFDAIHSDILENLPPCEDIIDASLDVDANIRKVLQPCMLHIIKELELEEDHIRNYIRDFFI